MLKGKYKLQASLNSLHVMLKRYTDSFRAFAVHSFPTFGLSTPYNVSKKGWCPSEPGVCLWFQIMALLTKGNKQRTQESTAANKTSSRSHAILQVKKTHTKTLTMYMTSNWHTVWVCVSCFVCSTGDSQAKEPCKGYQRGGQGGKAIHGRLGRNWASITGSCCVCVDVLNWKRKLSNS